MGRGHDLAEGTRTQCCTDIVTESIAPSQERQRVLQHSWKASLLRRKWLKNGGCCSNLSLKQIQRMKLLKMVSVLPLGVFSVRLSCTKGEEMCEWSSGWGQLSKASPGCSRASKEDSDIRWIKRRTNFPAYFSGIVLAWAAGTAQQNPVTTPLVGCE